MVYCIALAPYVSGILQCQSEWVWKCALSMHTSTYIWLSHYSWTHIQWKIQTLVGVVQKAGIEEQECTEMHRNTHVAGTCMQCTKLQHPLMSIIISNCQSACGISRDVSHCVASDSGICMYSICRSSGGKEWNTWVVYYWCLGLVLATPALSWMITSAYRALHPILHTCPMTCAHLPHDRKCSGAVR